MNNYSPKGYLQTFLPREEAMPSMVGGADVNGQAPNSFALMQDQRDLRSTAIDDIRNRLKEVQGREVSPLDGLSLAPMAAVLDGIYGTNTAGAFMQRGPSEADKKDAELNALTNQLQRAEQGQIDDQIQMARLMAEDARVREMRDESSRQKELDRQLRRDMLRDRLSSKTTSGGVPGSPGMTKGVEALDKNFAKTYSEDFLSGKIASAEKNLSQLRNVSQMLGSRDDLTGGWVGNVPMMGRRRFYQDSANAQQTVEDVVQQSLKAILGAQFTEKEAARLIERAYDPALDENINKERVDRLLKVLQSGIDRKKQAGQWFEKYGTMGGYKGTRYQSVDDIINDFDSAGVPSSGAGSAPTKNIDQMSEDELDAYLLKLEGN